MRLSFSRRRGGSLTIADLGSQIWDFNGRDLNPKSTSRAPQPKEPPRPKGHPSFVRRGANFVRKVSVDIITPTKRLFL